MLDHFPTKINPESLPKLVKLARLEVFEPFQGEQNLERMQQARSSIEKSVSKATKKTTDWIEETGIVGKAQSQFADLKGKLPWGKKNAQPAAQAEEVTKSLQRVSKEKLGAMQAKLWEGAKAYAFKGFDLLWKENPEEWILPKASTVLGRELKSLGELQLVTDGERAKLLEQLYPYNSTNVQKLAKGFEVSVNISLGLIVATNLPGTGILVSGINTIKTIVKVASGVQVLSALYGYHIQSQEALFTLCGKIIASMGDAESNLEHTPLSYTELEPLFTASAGKAESDLETLISEAFKKEAYIAIPGVGMLSLGKIQLDDYKAEQMILALLEKRQIYLELSSKMEQNLLLQSVQEIRDLFCQLKVLDAPAMLKVYLQNRPEVKSSLEGPKRQKKDQHTVLFQALDTVVELFYSQAYQDKRAKEISLESLQELFHLFVTNPKVQK